MKEFDFNSVVDIYHTDGNLNPEVEFSDIIDYDEQDRDYR